jgi:hypothetical protein
MIALWCGSSAADTYVTGDITSSTVWTPAGSPYIIQADVEITGNSTLTMDPGTVVAFDGNFDLSTASGSAIKVEGEEGNRVLITSNSATPQPGDWRWIQVLGSNQSSFEYCTVEYGYQGIRVNSASPDPWIYYCVIRNCSGAGVFCAGGSPTIERCDICACRDGIDIGSQPSDPAITNNNIYGNTHWNVYVMNYAEPARTINCENNWWGMDNEAEIAQEIYDSNDDPSLFATIDYDPWWTQQPVEESSWARVKALFN